MAAKPEAKSGVVNYLIVGKTGVGKTSLINSVAGIEIAEEGNELDIGTFDVESFKVTHESTGTTLQFWDTPGLFDMTKKSDLYMDKICDKYGECDLVLYCSDMTDTRITQQDKRTIHAFTQSLGAAFWQRSCFILTFGNCVEDPRSRKTTAEYFADTIKRLRAAYGKVLKEAGVSADVIDKIPFVPAGYHPWSPDKEMYILLDGKNWISAFWISCFTRVKEAQQVPRTAPPQRPRPASRPPPRQVTPTRDQCTFKAHHRDYIRQDWFECHTCWGGNSQFGCCWPCALDCHKDHQLVRHHPIDEKGTFFCDCGLNRHQPAVCTFNSTNNEFRHQPFYRCRSCFSRGDAGVCHQCMINCHRGHEIAYAGEILCFCDCGLPWCKVNCRIPKPT